MLSISRFPLCVALAVSLVAVTVVKLPAAEKRSTGSIRNPQYDPDAEVVKLFDGLEEGKLSARVVAGSAFEANVHITNETEKPLTVVLPKAAAAVHVLKQYVPQDGQLFGFGGNTQQQQGNGQAVGGPFQNTQNNQSNPFIGPANPGGQNLFNGNGFFSIPPEKTVVTQLQTVCLDHGKPSPTPGKLYVLRKLEDVVSNKTLRSLLENYDPEKTGRMTMQAIAWHLDDGLEWRELRAKQRRRLAGLPRPFFTRRQLEEARILVLSAGGEDDEPERKRSSRVRTFAAPRR